MATKIAQVEVREINPQELLKPVRVRIHGMGRMWIIPQENGGFSVSHRKRPDKFTPALLYKPGDSLTIRGPRRTLRIQA